eukprot:comp23561_c0_seq1/m.39817 comp23561_c0_seq1/g.39817  ORF comp23561_c0_seq1/g.39817 comp23561_c0_seq1/m.39817 type:complete len:103 (-) comp23561_c0_seq1:719-1027(-)
MSLPVVYSSGLQRTATATLWLSAVLVLRSQHTSTGMGQQAKKPAVPHQANPSASSSDSEKSPANMEAYRKLATWEGATESKKRNVWEEAMHGLTEDSKFHPA